MRIIKKFINPDAEDLKELNQLISNCDHNTHALLINGDTEEDLTDLYWIDDHGMEGITTISLAEFTDPNTLINQS